MPRLSLKNTHSMLFITECFANTSFAPLGSKAVITFLKWGMSAQVRPLALCPSPTSESRTGPLRVVTFSRTVNFLNNLFSNKLFTSKVYKSLNRNKLCFSLLAKTAVTAQLNTSLVGYNFNFEKLCDS